MENLAFFNIFPNSFNAPENGQKSLKTVIFIYFLHFVVNF